MITFGNIKEFVAPFVGGGGVCPDDPRCLNAVNEAVERLIGKPDLAERLVIRSVRLWSQGNYVTLPPSIDRILRLRVHGALAQPHTMWFEFFDGGPGLRERDGVLVAQDLYDLGETPVRFDIPQTAPGFRLLLVPDTEEDRGTTVLIRGTDDTGREVFTEAGVGERLPVAPKLVTRYSQHNFNRVSAVIKPKTKGYLFLYAYDPATGERHFLSEYHPDETNPRYRRYGHRGWNYDSKGNAACYELAALVKLRFTPMTRDEDISLISNRPAIKSMIQAIHMYDVGELEKAVAYEGIAEKLLSDETLNYSGDPAESLDVQATSWLHGGIEAIV